MININYLIPIAVISLAEPENTGEIITEFAKAVTTHVLLHELGHAILHEFEIPILSNEEAMADAFATHFTTQKLRDKAPDILISRAQSWIFEDSQISPLEYDHKGEHDLDIRRAYQTLCLFYGADPVEFARYVGFAGFTEAELSDCSDTAPRQIDDWAAILQKLPRLESGIESKVEIIYGEGPMKEAMQASGIIEMVAGHAGAYAWQNPITFHFDHCDVGASWSRSKRTILLCDDYVQRFVTQGIEIQQSK